MRRRHWAALATALAIISSATTAVTHRGHDTPSATAAPVTLDTAADIATLLTQVHVVATIPKHHGYERGCKKNQGCVFGPAWNDPNDHSGCDRRNLQLARDLVNVEFKPKTHNCKVISGVLHDPYTGHDVNFSSTAPTEVQLDHIVPLSKSWNAGAYAWPLQLRRQFANDPVNLQSVSGPVNAAKSDSPIGEWLPPNMSYRCTYIQRYLTVSVKYALPISERDRSVAATCQHHPAAAA